MKNGWLVRDVARLCGVSIRLLHHWDYMGLVSPSERLPNGYRLYGEEDIRRIQQALLYRATGMSLEHIRELLDSHQDEERHLRNQLELLEHASRELDRKLHAVHQLLEECMKGKTLSIEEKASLMGKDWLPEWEEEAGQKWGDTPDWQQTQDNLSKMSPQDWQAHKAGMQEMEESMALLCAKGVSPESETAMERIEEYRKLCSKHHFEITWAKHVLLARMYTEDERFNAYYEKYCTGLASWIRTGIEANAKRHGVDPAQAEWV